MTTSLYLGSGIGLSMSLRWSRPKPPTIAIARIERGDYTTGASRSLAAALSLHRLATSSDTDPHDLSPLNQGAFRASPTQQGSHPGDPNSITSPTCSRRKFLASHCLAASGS